MALDVVLVLVPRDVRDHVWVLAVQLLEGLRQAAQHGLGPGVPCLQPRALPLRVAGGKRIALERGEIEEALLPVEALRSASALYLTSYYVGGTLGSTLPGLAFQGLGWAGVVVTCAAAVVVAGLLMRYQLRFLTLYR